MRRRAFLQVLWTTAASATFRVPAAAQTAKPRPLIVWLGSAVKAGGAPYEGFLKSGLQDLGLVEGRDYDFADRFAEFHAERLPALAAEVAALRPAVIVASAVDTALVLKNVTSTIPIVSGALADAEHLGLVESYARPKGNVTGIMPYVAGLPGKQIELALEVVPGARTIGLLGNANEEKVPPQIAEMRQVAARLSKTLVIPPVATPSDLQPAVKAFSEAGVDVALVLESTMLLVSRKQIAELMAAARLPAVYGYREHVDQGGLISYGVDLSWCWRRLATLVQKILTGTPPGNIPVEFPTKLQLVISQKAAQTIGYIVPPSLLTQADEVIE